MDDKEKPVVLTVGDVCRLIDIIDDAVRLHVPYSVEVISSLGIGTKRLLFTLDQLEKQIAAVKLKAKKGKK